MNRDMAEKIANAVLYEGYMLYPYRTSAVKNQQRWNFGTLYPAQFDEVRRGTERSSMHVECLAQLGDEISISLRARYLQFNVDAVLQGATERAVELTLNSTGPTRQDFRHPGISGGVKASVRLCIDTVADGISKLIVDLVNEFEIEPTIDRGKVLPNSLVSAHIILCTQSGGFLSLMDPPAALQTLTSQCKNIGCFPVLVGEEGSHDMMLCSPIILYDYPQIAPESAGDFFDGTEMDEMLTLRVMTLTDEEKREMRGTDDRVRSLLERTEQTAREQLTRTHGTIRSLRQIDNHD